MMRAIRDGMAPLARLLSVGLLVSFVISGFGLLALAPIASADHDTISWSRSWTIATNPRWIVIPSVLADGKGSVYFFFYDLNPANGQTNITVWKYATRGSDGNPQFLVSRQVNPTLPNVAYIFNWYGYAWPPSAAIDHDGNLYVAWTSRVGPAWDVYVSKSADGGLTWGAPSRVDAPSANSLDSGPTIVASSSGTLYVAWFQFWSPGGFRNLTVARSTDKGVTWIGKTNVTSGLGIDYLSQALAADAAGRIHLAYTSSSPGNVHVNYTWSDDGSSWSAPARLDGGVSGWTPAIAVDGRSRVHVFWYDGRRSTSLINTYWYRRSDDRGASWSMEMPISQGRYSTGLGVVPTIAVHGDTVIAGWSVYSPTFTLGYTISPDGGDLWYPEAVAEFGTAAFAPSIASDENGTFYAGYYIGGNDPAFSIWDGPPTAPVISGIARGPSSLTVSWTASPEGDVSGYRLWRSVDGVSYELAGTFGPTTLTYADSGLSNGTYWYRVTSFDVRGTASHVSDPMSASVGKSLSERIDELQGALNNAQADITAIQAQLDALRSQLTSQDATNRARIDDLQSRLNAIQAEKATQSQTWVNTILIIVVIVLLVFLYMQSRRIAAIRPQVWSPQPPSSPREGPPPGPTMAPPQSPSEPGLSDEEL